MHQKAVRLRKPGPPSRFYETGRVCEEIGCVQTLNRYNPGPTCHQHDRTRFPRVRGQIDARL